VNRPVAPATLPPPAAAYSHAVLVEGAARVLHTSGIVPTADDGSVPEALAGQAALVWRKIGEILGEAGMAVTDIVAITTYVVPGQDLSVVMAARDTFMAGHRPASTLVVVAGLAQAAWKLEISAVAAR
jgi:enamine deaminase RidA (YjgF/YER057c/UK114 family)